MDRHLVKPLSIGSTFCTNDVVLVDVSNNLHCVGTLGRRFVQSTLCGTFSIMDVVIVYLVPPKALGMLAAF